MMQDVWLCIITPGYRPTVMKVVATQELADAWLVDMNGRMSQDGKTTLRSGIRRLPVEDTFVPYDNSI